MTPVTMEPSVIHCVQNMEPVLMVHVIVDLMDTVVISVKSRVALVTTKIVQAMVTATDLLVNVFVRVGGKELDVIYHIVLLTVMELVAVMSSMVTHSVFVMTHTLVLLANTNVNMELTMENLVIVIHATMISTVLRFVLAKEIVQMMSVIVDLMVDVEIIVSCLDVQDGEVIVVIMENVTQLTEVAHVIQDGKVMDVSILTAQGIVITEAIVTFSWPDQSVPAVM